MIALGQGELPYILPDIQRCQPEMRLWYPMVSCHDILFAPAPEAAENKAPLNSTQNPYELEKNRHATVLGSTVTAIMQMNLDELRELRRIALLVVLSSLWWGVLVNIICPPQPKTSHSLPPSPSKDFFAPPPLYSPYPTTVYCNFYFATTFYYHDLSSFLSLLLLHLYIAFLISYFPTIPHYHNL